MASLQGKVIAITGAGSGIGLATARECAARGASLALCDINQEAVDRVVREIKELKSIDVIGTRVDVSNCDSVDAWISEVMAHFGRLDGAANVAGVNGPPGGLVFANIVDITNEHWDFMMGVNLTGLFYCLRAQLRVMERGASILNVSSLAGQVGRAGLGAYVASKHGVIGLTRSAAKEVGERGIRVNVLAPGPVDSPMLDRLKAGTENDDSNQVTNSFKTIPLRKIGAVEEMAKTICFALSDDASHTTGATFSVDGGMVC